jgi:hypothetical protein
MTQTIRTAAQAYAPKATIKNIAELDYVHIDLETFTETRKDDKGEEYTLILFRMNGETYRIPESVLNKIKTYLAKIPALKYVSVTRTGTDLKNTKYEVIPRTDLS